MISRKIIFGNPEKAHARISPDGKKIAYLAPFNGVLNVWVGSVKDPSTANPVTTDTGRGIRSFFWAYTSTHLIYPQDDSGDENWHIYSVNLSNNEVKDLTPIPEIAARIQEVSRQFPEKILVGINDRGERQFHDIYEVDISTADRVLVQSNPGFAAFMTDDAFQVRFALTFMPDGGQMYLHPDSLVGWKEFSRIDPTDAMTTNPIGFDKSGDRYYMLDSRGRDKSALKLVEIKTGEEKLLAESEKADIDGVVIHPTTRTVQAATFTYARQEWCILDPEIRSDFEYLQAINDGQLKVTSRSDDDRFWTVAFIVDDGSTRFYLYDRASKSHTFLFTSQPDLEDLPLVKMHSQIIKARDGLDLVAYFSLPAQSDPARSGCPTEPLPTVLMVHGGPWARDDWGFSQNHQWLANRGYAVLSVNYRGSTGFGKDFINKANGEWAGAMHEDLIDAVNWAIDQKIADPARVGIMGGSYGGYATLVGLTFSPETFACGVDIVGPSNLITMMENPPPYWVPLMPIMKHRIGDCTTKEGRELLEAKSPLHFVDRIRRPLLIAQGKNDPRVKQVESDQIVAAMNQKDIPVSYMLFTEEGHGFAKPENRQAFYAIVEAFLAEHLGGDYEVIGDAFQGAKFEVRSGEGGVPGLSAALHSTNVT